MDSNTTPPQTSSTNSGAPGTTAREYYNAPSTNTFYQSLWGGEHIHIGTYLTPSDPISLASERTVARMATLAAPITPATRVLDIGAGYGGAARWLARQYGCKVTCLNISEVQNERNRAITREQGLEALIEVVTGSFEALPFAEGEFDLVWCQDCLLHAGDRGLVVREIARVLAEKGARVMLSDHMAVEGADEEKMRPIKERLKLKLGLATRREYRDAFLAPGFEEVEYVEGTEHMVMHCGKVLEALREGDEHLPAGVSEAFAENAKTGMKSWVDGGRKGYLEWGYMLFRR